VLREGVLKVSVGHVASLTITRSGP
jgi:hypothetical protein